MAAKSNAYWDNRAKTNMDSYLRDSDETIALLSKAYQRTLRGIESDIENIFENYRKRHALTREQALEYLASPISRSEYEGLLSLVDGVADPLLRQDMLARINAPAYQYRMSREVALQADINARMAQLADVEIFEDTRLFHEIIEDAYGHTLFDIQKGTGYGFRVDAMSPGLMQGILRNPWSGELFSERVWKNTGILADQLNEVLTDALQRGRSWRQTAEELAGRMSVGYHEAERLVRTESVYMANTAEMEGYKAAGIARYRFLATLDSHTCDVCGALDGETFEVSAAMPGENMPPMHPNDRCTTVAEFDDMHLSNFERMAHDPVTGENYKVPADMSYAEWQKWQDLLQNGGTNGIIALRGSGKSMRYAVTQELIDEVVAKDLAEYVFPVQPVYNPRIRANGLTRARFNSWGQAQITEIQIGKQDSPSRDFLVDTLLHEWLEAEIMVKQYSDPFYRKLDKAGDVKRHAWINKQIQKFFKERG